jgi:FKBP-type peptidyl-prolyl cis-trans isomerase SlyD
MRSNDSKSEQASGDKATIADGKVVTLDYVLRDDEGTELDSSASGEPLCYLHGAGNVLPGLEAGLVGHALGDHLEIVVDPEEGFGEHDPRGIQRVSRDTFPPDTPLRVGLEFEAEGPDGDAILGRVLEVSDDEVTIDLNHPLAGVTLCFDVTVAAVRDATSEELAHGHPHGADGHHAH